MTGKGGRDVKLAAFQKMEASSSSTEDKLLCWSSFCGVTIPDPDYVVLVLYNGLFMKIIL
jgi:hypothetical protein